MWATWEGFLFGLQEASDFVDVHKPVVTEKLLEMISVSTCTALQAATILVAMASGKNNFGDQNSGESRVIATILQLKVTIKK